MCLFEYFARFRAIEDQGKVPVQFDHHFVAKRLPCISCACLPTYHSLPGKTCLFHAPESLQTMHSTILTVP